MDVETQVSPASSPQPAADSALLPLDGERVVSFWDGAHAFTLVFRRIESADWKRVFATLRVKDQVWSVDHVAATLELLQSNLLRAQGYRMKDGSDFMARPDWKMLIPSGHKQKAAALLLDAPAEYEDKAGHFDPVGLAAVVKLDAAWGASEPGKMARYKGLTHILKPPASEHSRRFYSKESALADLYDELVVSVSGYGVAGRPLEGAEQIRREMDDWHKTVVMAKLFFVPGEGEGEEEKHK